MLQYLQISITGSQKVVIIQHLTKYVGKDEKEENDFHGQGLLEIRA